MVVGVECRESDRGETTPAVLGLGTRRVNVVEVVDQWLGSDHRYFKLVGDDGDTYIVRHDVANNRWELTMFSAGSRNGPR